jgi:hypothetical protein
VRRLVAFALVQALAVSTSMASSLHVHEYVGHDHPEHHHGPAAHDHHDLAPADQDDHTDAGDEDHLAWQADPCEAGRHAVVVSMGCAWIMHGHIDLAELPGLTIVVASATIRSALPFTDVRVHGPPFDPRIPSRAPPLYLHA